MDDSLETRTLSDYLRVLRARRRLVIATTLVAAGAALLISLSQTPVYKSSASVSFNSQFFPQAQQAPTPGTASPNLAAGLALVTRTDVLEGVSRSLGGDPTPAELASQVSAVVDPSNLVQITAEGDSAEGVAEIANATARETKEVARDEARAYFRRTAATTDDENLRTLAKVADPVAIVRSAAEPASPASPKPLRNALIAGGLGLLLGIGIAFVRHAFDRRITDAHQAQRDLGLPLVGYVRSEALGLVGMSENGSTMFPEDDLEACRILRTNVDFLAGGEDVKVVAVTSPLPEEGKSTVAIGYAYANALAGRNTLLVECDLRRPVLGERLGCEPSPGLSDHLVGDAKPARVLRSLDVEGPSAQPLAVIPAGLDVSHPAELIASPEFESFLSQIAKVYELVVLDCPPLLPVGDTLELLPRVDAVLLCVRIGQTTREQASAAKEALDHLPHRPTGLVITGLDRGSDEDYYGYYSTHPPAERVGATH